jgi:type IV pilus assembly protein PilQ
LKNQKYISKFSRPSGIPKKAGKILYFGLSVFCILIFGFWILSFAQEAVTQTETKTEEQPALEESLSSSQNITMDFKDADIRNVLKIISYKAGVNIVATPEVMASVTIRLVDVPWERALDTVLKTYGFGYERQGNVIFVSKIENISKLQAEEPLRTETFSLKYLDAQDAQKVVVSLLSPRGTTSILYTRGQKGWQFGTFKIGREITGGALKKEEGAAKETEETVALGQTTAAGGAMTVSATRAKFEPSVKSKILIVTDTAATLDKIRNFIAQIDQKPKQVVIETRIMEVSRAKLKDIGVDFGTGTTGVTAIGHDTLTTNKITNRQTSTLGSHGIGTGISGAAAAVIPSIFSPSATGLTPLTAGLELIYRKLTGPQFEVVIHALEEDVNTNTLSAPRIVTLDNQEAAILVGYHTPILSSTVTAASTTTGPTMTQTLDYYQEIGIRLNVVPQVSEEGYINMLIHPSVTSSTTHVTATSIAAGTPPVTSTVDYPIIDVREAQTQVMMKDGETIVIGGLLKDIKGKSTIGIPFLSKIPIFGALFRRDTIDNTKIDLLIFITARILKENEYPPEVVAKLEENLGKDKDKVIKKKNK